MTIRYKWRNAEHTAVTDTEDGDRGIPVDHRFYKKVVAWVEDGNEIEAYETAEDLATREAAEALAAQKDADRAAKLEGVEFEGVMCSATAEDMWGLSAIRAWVIAGQDTPFKFENGNVLVLTSTNVTPFEAVWAPFRASFFSA